MTYSDKCIAKIIVGLYISLYIGLLYIGLLFPLSAFGDVSPDVQAPTCDSAPVKNKIDKATRFDKKKIKRYEGRIIGKIEIDVENIFDESDPKEDKWLYRLANDIQVNTRETTIRNQLLFEEGEPIVYETINETMRILYQRSYLLDVKLTVIDACRDTVNLKIIVKDAWVITPKLSFGKKGGVSTSAIGITDGNFLGTGNLFSIEYEQEAERNRFGQRFYSPNFLGTKVEADFQYVELTDGVEQKVLLKKPFYSLRTRWAYGGEVGETRQSEIIRNRGDIVDEYAHAIEYYQFDWGYSFAIGKSATHRIVMGVTREDHVFYTLQDTVNLPEWQEEVYSWIQISRESSAFERYRNLDYIARDVSIPMGFDYSIRYGSGRFNGNSDLHKIISEFNYNMAFDEKHLFKLKANFEHRFIFGEDGEAFQSKIQSEIKYNYFINGVNRWYVGAQYFMGENLLPHQEYTLGEIEGVRGYPIGFQRGDRGYILNMERRLYTKAHWFNLIRFGVVGFVDVGHVWGLDRYSEGDAQNKALVSAGLGLRFHSSKSGTPAVVHINLSKPLRYRNDPDLDNLLLSISVEKTF